MQTPNCQNGLWSVASTGLYFCVQGFKRQGFECFDNLFRKETVVSESDMKGDC